MVDYKDRLAEAMHRAQVSTSGLAAALDVSYQAIKKVLDGQTKSLSAKNNDAAADFLGVNSSWLATGKGLMDLPPVDLNVVRFSRAPSKGGVAHPMSLASDETASPLSWEQLMKEQQQGALPHVFRAIVPDDAMAPMARKGEVLLFNRGVTPRYGDGVIVSDQAGALYLRQYREGAAPGIWIAHAKNENYRSLQSDVHGLAIVAVVRIPERGWADL